MGNAWIWVRRFFSGKNSDPSPPRTMKRMVFKLDLPDERYKKKVMEKVSSLAGVESVNLDMKGQKMTVIGEIDSTHAVMKLSNLRNIKVVYIGPAKEEKKVEKKEELKKEGYAMAEARVWPYFPLKTTGAVQYHEVNRKYKNKGKEKWHNPEVPDLYSYYNVPGVSSLYYNVPGESSSYYNVPGESSAAMKQIPTKAESITSIGSEQNITLISGGGDRIHAIPIATPSTPTGDRVEQIPTKAESIMNIGLASSPIDCLPCHLVELDLKDCNISDDDNIFKNITCLCSLKYLNLSGNLITTLPEGITRLTELQNLKLSRCKRLRSLPELPASLQELKLYCCSSLQKVVNLPNLFRSLRLDVRNYDIFVEVQELFTLKQ